MKVGTVLRSTTRYVTVAAVLLLTCYAVIVVIARQALPTLARYQPEINEFFSRQLGVELSTENIGGTWKGLTPRIEVSGLRLGAATNVLSAIDPTGTAGKNVAETLYIAHLSAELDLLSSLFERDLVWHDLRLGEISIVLSEAFDGSWSVMGLPITGLGEDEESDKLAQSLRRILLNRFIHIEQLSAAVLFHSGIKAAVSFSDIKLETADDFHRLTAGFAFDDKPSSAQLIIEGRGDVLDIHRFEGAGYLRLNRINFSGSLSSMVGRWFPKLVERIGDIESELTADIWLDSAEDGQINLVGRLKAEELPLSWAADLPPIKNLSAELTGWFKPRASWGARGQALDFDWAGIDIEPLNLSLSQRVDAKWSQLSLAASQLNLATLTRILTSTGLVADTTEQVVASLDSKGHLENLHIDIDLDKPFPLEALYARVDHLSISSWRDAPAIRDLSGYIEWRDSGGFFELESPDGFAMHFPGVYEDFMEYGSSQGRINIEWQEDVQALQLAGGPIQIEGKEGQIRAYLSLDIPLSQDGERQMWLLAGIKNSQPRYADQYIPKILNPALLGWLDRAVGDDMDIVEGGFIWRGSLAKEGVLQRSVQVYTKVANGDVKYDPGWPPLTDMSAYIAVDNGALSGVVGPARIGNSGHGRLARAVIKTVSTEEKQPGQASNFLSVLGHVTTPLDEAANIMLASPLSDRFAPLTDWRLQGQTEVQLDLIIPLDKPPKSEAQQLPAGSEAASLARDTQSIEHYRVDAKLKNGQMTHKTQGIGFDDITGLIAYSDEKGIYSPGIDASIWGQKFNATITTSDGQTKFESSGRFDVATLPAWNSLFTQHVTGASDYLLSFNIPQEGSPNLLFNSSLEGVEIDFPLPLSKLAEPTIGLEARLIFADELMVETKLGDHLTGSFIVANQQITRGQIALGGVAAEPTAVPELPGAGLSIVGTTPILDLDAWLAALKPVEGSSESATGIDLVALAPTFSVVFGELLYLDTSVTNAHVTGGYDVEGLNVHIDSQVLSGQIVVPADKAQPSVMDLNYLTLPKPELDNDENFLDQLDPLTFPYLNFASQGIRIGDNELGSLAFLINPLPDGVELSNIRAEITGIEISDLPVGESSSFTWRVKDGVHRSQFAGLLKTYDLGAVLKAWQLPVVLDSEKAISIVDLSWPDKPWNFSVNTLSGQSALNFKDGNFFRAPGNTTNALIKLIGLINFNTWARRLRLDFTDLFASGVVYESLEGGLQFSDGDLAFDAPIVVDLPSGKMRLMGQADLLAETVDAHLVATLPVGTNLPWIAALAGGLPAAAGVYLTGKLFEKQVDRVSSFSYKVTGPWDEPEVQINRIFSDKTGG